MAFKTMFKRKRARATMGAALTALACLCVGFQPPRVYADAPAGVAVPVRLTERISSDKARTGERFTFVTTKAVKVGDVTVPAGTPGHGVVASVRAARWDRGGELDLEVQSLDLPDGLTIAVVANRGPSGEHQNVAADALKTAENVKPGEAITSALVPLSLAERGVVLLGSALKILKGHNVAYDAGTTFSVVAIPPQGTQSSPPGMPSSPPAMTQSPEPVQSTTPPGTASASPQG